MFYSGRSDTSTTASRLDSTEYFGEAYLGLDDLSAEAPGEEVHIEGPIQRKSIAVGDYLPYGPRMYYETVDNVIRMRDIGVKSRVLVVGVIGSFTPDCWNRHLFRVLQEKRYYEERSVDYICCIATNDAFTQKAWGVYLGCDDSVLMLADSTRRFTKALGMDVVVPWLDNTVRSKRYVILADDMLVTKMIAAPSEDRVTTFECEHLMRSDESEETGDEPWL